MRTFGIDFYNQTIARDGTSQTLACVASTDKNKTGGVLVIRYECNQNIVCLQPSRKRLQRRRNGE